MLAVAIAFAGLVWLAMDDASLGYTQISAALREVTYQDANLDGEVLALHTGIHQNYDCVAAVEHRLEEASSFVRQACAENADVLGHESSQTFADLETHVAGKLTAVQDYKATLSIVRNARAALFTHTARLASRQNGNRTLVEAVMRLESAVARFSASGTRVDRSRLQAAIDTYEQAASDLLASDDRSPRMVLRLSRVVMNHQWQLDDAVQQLATNALQHHCEQALQRVRELYQDGQQRISLYKMLSVLPAACVLMYCGLRYRQAFAAASQARSARAEFEKTYDELGAHRSRENGRLRSLEAILRDAPLEVYVARRHDLRLVEANIRACRSIGLARDQVLEMHLHDLFAEEETVRLEEALQPLIMRTRKSVEFETTHRLQEGEAYPVAVTVYATNFNEVPCFVVFAADQTKARLLDGQLARAGEFEPIS